MLFINDLLEELREECEKQGDGCATVAYADDTTIVLSADSDEKWEIAAQRIADILQRWADVNHEPIHTKPGKTTILMIKRTDKNFVPKVTMNGQRINVSDKHIILGVFFNNELNFKQHVEWTTMRATRRLGALRALCAQRWGVSVATARTLQISHIGSLCEHGIASWFPLAPKKDLKKLDNVLLSAARITAGLPRCTDACICFHKTQSWCLGECYKLKAITLAERIKSLSSCRLHMDFNSRVQWQEKGLKQAFDLAEYYLPAKKYVRSSFPNASARINCVKHMDKVVCSTDTMWCDDDVEAEIQMGKFDLVGATDGSVEPEGVNAGAGGAAFLVLNKHGELLKEWAGSAGRNCTSYCAEKLAIKRVLAFLRDAALSSGCNACLVLTDSMSVIQKIESGTPESGNDVELFDAINELASIAKIKFRHVKAHVGITLNERADKLADQGKSIEIIEGNATAQSDKI